LLVLQTGALITEKTFQLAMSISGMQE
jgi:hypothetical protein